MIKKLNKIYYFIFSIALIYFCLFIAFYIVCFFDKEGLYKLIIKYKTYDNLPFTLSDIDLKNISIELMQYISGKLQFLETNVTIDGILQDFYSIRSKIHMADVRNLIVNFRNICFISIAICIFTLFKICSFDSALHNLKDVYKNTFIIITLLITSLIIFASTNFDFFFTKFHEALFDNDLWLLDPSTDYIICLLPQKIFMIYGIKIIISMIIAVFLPYFFLVFLSKTQPVQEAK